MSLLKYTIPHSCIINFPFFTGSFLSAYKYQIYCDFSHLKKDKPLFISRCLPATALTQRPASCTGNSPVYIPSQDNSPELDISTWVIKTHLKLNMKSDQIHFTPSLCRNPGPPTDVPLPNTSGQKHPVFRSAQSGNQILK